MNDLASTPQPLRFIQLGEISEITMGQSPDSQTLNSNEEGVPFLQGCAEFGRRSPLTAVFCDPPLRVSKPDSILISVRAPVGTLNWGDQGYCIGRGLAAIRAVEKLARTDFLFYVLVQHADFLHRRSQGSTFLAIGANDLKSFPVPAFNVKQQHKIAHILQIIDQAIEKTEALIDKYQQIKSGLMHDLFTRGIGPDGHLRPPREQAPELYQDTSIGWIPKDWAPCRLDEACNAIIDCPHSTPTFTDDGVFAARTMHIKDGVFLAENASTVSESEYLERVSRAVPQAGDVIFTREAPVGEAFVIPAGMKICLGQRVMLIKPRAALLDSSYLVEQIYAGRLKSRISDLTAGTTNPHLNVADLRELLIPLPRFSEQQQMMEMAGAMNGRVQSERALLIKLNKQKSGLMQALLSGKVPVQVETEDEPEIAHV